MAREALGVDEHADDAGALEGEAGGGLVDAGGAVDMKVVLFGELNDDVGPLGGAADDQQGCREGGRDEGVGRNVRGSSLRFNDGCTLHNGAQDRKGFCAKITDNSAP